MSDPDESGFRWLSEAELYESLIQAARDGDRDHAVGLLEDFIAAGTSDELGPVPTYLIRYIAECLQFWQSDGFQGKKSSRETRCFRQASRMPISQKWI